jgi:hypothetical protein
VIEWCDGVAAGLERTVLPITAEEFALQRWAAHGYEPDLAALGDSGDWTQLNGRGRTGQWPPRRSCGSTRRTRPSSSSRSKRIRTTGGSGWPGR